MEPVVGPATAAGGRILSSLIKTRRVKRKASLQVAVETFPGEQTTNIRVMLTNPRKNQNEVVVERIKLVVQVHDESCAEPEYKRLSRGVFGEYPKFPLNIEVGQIQSWQAGISLVEVRRQWIAYVEEAKLRTWGKEHLELMQEDDSGAWTSGDGGSGLISRIARVLKSIDDTGPTIKAIVKTRHDGEVESRPFHLNPDTWSRIKTAFSS